MRLVGFVIGFVILGLLAGPVAEAFIPAANRTLRAIAATNRASRRTQAIQLELTMRVGEEAPLARGELISHPSGDRYLLSGSELSGAMNGQRLSRPRPLLQPLFLLQPGSETTLRAALESFSVRTDAIGLAPCGDEDCFVIGDPRLAAPIVIPELLGEAPESGLGDPLLAPEGEYTLAAEGERLDGPALRSVPEGGIVGVDEAGNPIAIDSMAGFGSISRNATLARLWVDTQELQVRRIDRLDGSYVVFGPMASFAKLMVPAWFEVYEPDQVFPMRFEVDRAVQVNAPPKAFGQSWLLDVPPPPAAAPGAAGAGAPLGE
jgi:hypothetical protein